MPSFWPLALFRMEDCCGTALGFLMPQSLLSHDSRCAAGFEYSSIQALALGESLPQGHSCSLLALFAGPGAVYFFFLNIKRAAYTISSGTMFLVLRSVAQVEYQPLKVHLE